MPVNCLLVSALHLFCLRLEKKVGGLEGASFLSLMGVALSRSATVGVLTSRAMGMCLVRKKNDGSVDQVCTRGV